MNRPPKEKAPTSAKTLGADGAMQLSFLPEPPFCPTWPTKGTLPDVALTRFLAGELLTSPDFEAETESWRLAAVVCNLRDWGWPVVTLPLTSPTEADPCRTIAAYHLPGKYAAAALALRNPKEAA